MMKELTPEQWQVVRDLIADLQTGLLTLRNDVRDNATLHPGLVDEILIEARLKTLGERVADRYLRFGTSPDPTPSIGTSAWLNASGR